MPVDAVNVSASAGGSGAEPLVTSRRRRSGVSPSGPSSSSRRWMLGTPNSTVACSRSTVSTSASGENRLRIAALDPAATVACTPLSPCWW